jgi:hypothetical protein
MTRLVHENMCYLAFVHPLNPSYGYLYAEAPGVILHLFLLWSGIPAGYYRRKDCGSGMTRLRCLRDWQHVRNQRFSRKMA